jgi:hypothetical protein
MKVCILIQSNDQYGFLWEGLHLSWKWNWNWKKFPWKTYVITEEKNFQDVVPDSFFHTMKMRKEFIGAEHYSTKLIMSLKRLKEEGYDTVFYSQDDSWPDSMPDGDTLRSVIKFFDEHDADCFHFSDAKEKFSFTLQDTPYHIYSKKIKHFYGKSRFYFNHGTALWKIDSLLKILVEGEEPYENEWKTTMRIWESYPETKVYILNYSWYDQDEVHQKGKLLDSATKTIEALKYRDKWETEGGSSMYYYWNAERTFVFPMDHSEVKFYEEKIQIGL